MEYKIEKAMSMTDVNQIVEFISHTLKKPVILEDDQYALLSYSAYQITDFDQANQQTILSKRSPDYILEKFIEEGIIDQLKANMKPFRISKIAEIGLNHRVVVTVRYKQHILGFLWIQEIDQRLSDEEINFVYKTSLHIGKILYKKNQAKRVKGKKRIQFFRHLLRGPIRNEKQIRQEAEANHIRIPAFIKVIVIQLKNHEEDVFDNIKETVQSYLNVSSSMSEMFDEANQIIIVMGDSNFNRINEQAHDLVTRIGKSIEDQYLIDVFAGIGNAYGYLSLLKKSYTEALEVIKAANYLGTQENVPLEYDKLGVYRYIHLFAEHHKEINYVNPKLQKLIEKDRENQTELLKTLEVYLLNNCKAKPTAEQLFIHPNTLNYRLKQIFEYTSLDLTDFNQNCQLFIDILLLKCEANG